MSKLYGEPMTDAYATMARQSAERIREATAETQRKIQEKLQMESQEAKQRAKELRKESGKYIWPWFIGMALVGILAGLLVATLSDDTSVFAFSPFVNLVIGASMGIGPFGVLGAIIGSIHFACKRQRQK